MWGAGYKKFTHMILVPIRSSIRFPKAEIIDGGNELGPSGRALYAFNHLTIIPTQYMMP